MQQAQELIAFVKEHANPSTPPERGVVTIVAGDLNMRPFHPEYKRVAAGMNELGLVDAWDGVWEPTFGMVDENGNPREWLMTHRADHRTFSMRSVNDLTFVESNDKSLFFLFFEGLGG